MRWYASDSGDGGALLLAGGQYGDDSADFRQTVGADETFAGLTVPQLLSGTQVIEVGSSGLGRVLSREEVASVRECQYCGVQLDSPCDSDEQSIGCENMLA